MKLPKRAPDINSIFSIGKDNFIKLMKNEEVRKFVRKVNKEYLHWDEFIYRERPKGTKKEDLWTLIRLERSLNSRRINVGSGEKFRFSYNATDLIQEKLHEMDVNLGGSLETKNERIPPDDREKYLINSIMEEAIASSRLEGAATTRKVAKDMLKSNRKPKNESERMIMNNYDTIRMIKEEEVKELTPEFILKIHKTIVKDTMDEKITGKYRDNNEIVVREPTGKIVYHPPDYKLIPDLIKKICDFANKDGEFIHPIIKASILHFFMGYVHPFEDGNGRTARALFYWYMAKNNYWIIEFMSISSIIIKSPSRYVRAYLYAEYDENDLTYFIKYQIRTLDVALKELKKYVERSRKEKEKIFEIIRDVEGLNDRQIYVIEKFHEDKRKVMTIREVMTTFSVVYQTARKDLLELEERGFLEKKTMGKKKFIFLRSGNFRKLFK